MFPVAGRKLYNSIMFEVISTREFATITFFGILYISSFIKSKKMRADTWKFLSIVFDPRAFLIFDWFAIYETSLLLCITYLPFWKNAYYKDFVFWIFLCGFPFLISCNDNNQKSFRKIIWTQFFFSSISEYLTGLITFNLFVEYFLLIACSFLVIIDYLIEKEGHSSWILKGILGAFSVAIIIATIVKGANDFEKYDSIETIIKMLIPIGFYFSSVPYYYFFILIARYQELFCIINSLEKKYNKHTARKREALIWCGLSIDKVKIFRQLYPRYPNFTKDHFISITRKKLSIDQLMEMLLPYD